MFTYIIRPVGLFALLFFMFALNSCKKESCVVSYPVEFYEPVYSTWEEIKAEIGSEAPREITQPGKIFAIGSLLFINEVKEGIHVIDNTDPANPVNIMFINIPGSLDIAASSNKLYSDNYSDLVILDISDLSNVFEIDRVENVFFENSIGFWYDWTNDRVITGWETTETIYEYDCGDEELWLFEEVDFNGGIIPTADGPVAFSELGSDAAGKAGSMARFALHGSKMYALNLSELLVFNIVGDVSLDNHVYMEWGVETLFPYGDHLYVGAMNGMHIMSVEDPVNPLHISSYTHITSCDPVIVEDGLAYVTLRSGTECQGFTNQLDIIDLTDIYHPELLTSYEMFNPHGLGIGGFHDLLYLCDGDDGLKIYNRDDPMELELIEHYDGINTYDVIPYGNNLFMIGGDGFYQYDCADIEDIHQISMIPVGG